MKQSEVAKLIALLKTHADHNATQRELVAMWALAMDDVPYPAAEAAYQWWIKNKKWFPKPVELRQVIEEKVLGLPSVDDAWAQLERSLHENYPGQPPKYTPDPLVIEATRVVGGTYVFRNAQLGREFDNLRERFRQVYAQMRSERSDALDMSAEWQALSAGSPNGQHAAIEEAVRP